MDKYIIVTTLCNKESIANSIIDTLLDKHLVTGAQTSKVHSKYYWNNEYEEYDEIKIEFRTKLSLFEEIKTIIESIHDYETCEISVTEIINANDSFLKWIDDNIK